MQYARYILMGLAVALAPAMTLGQPASAAAQPAEEGEEAQERPPGPADLAEAIEIAEKHTGGKAASAETVERDGRQVHEVRIYLDDGQRVRTVRVDPATGAIIPQERGQR